MERERQVNKQPSISILKDLDMIKCIIQEEWYNTLSFYDGFSLSIAKEKQKLPYHLNIIDELHINENAHSRILYKLLLYKNIEGKHEFLESLIDYIKRIARSSNFNKIQVKEPKITQEKKRIDLWVRDKDYALIFENKIYNAKDQGTQIARYIDETRANNYKLKDIFVIYLPQDSSKEPEPQSWKKYQRCFEKRYINLSFREHILTWLEEDVLPQINSNDIYLRSAIRQYIDYLRGLFNIRTIQKQMNMNLHKILTTHYKLDECSTDQERIGIIEEKIEEINEISTQLESLKQHLHDKIVKSHVTKWVKDLQVNNYGEYYDEYVKLDWDDFIGVVLTVNNRKVIIRIYEEEHKGIDRLCCSIEYLDKNKYKMSSLKKLLQELLPDDNDEYLWKYFSIDDYNAVFNCFKNVIKKCLNS